MACNAAIVSIVDKLTKRNGAPCKKTLQKIVYLIEEKDVDLGCNYGIHFYGPYSSDLDFAVRELSADGVLKIKYSDTEHKISVVDASAYESDSIDGAEIIDSIIEEFGSETASELELIATSLYVYLQIKDPNKIRDDVMKIKGTKYTAEKIDAAIKRLEKAGYIAA